MKKTTIWIIVIVVLVGIALFIFIPRDNKGIEAEVTETEVEVDHDIIKVGDTSPLFTVKMFDGDEVSIADLKGKVVLIQFWATWCPPCREELSVVEKEIIERFEGKEFVYLPISREDTYEKIKEFREEFGYTFPMGMDPDRSIYSQFAVQTIPRNYILNKEGKVVFTEKGYSEELMKEMIQKIEEEL